MTFAPYADLLWLETKSPDLAQARYFARKIREKYPGKHVQFNRPFGNHLTHKTQVVRL